jgi:P4 family phage/plasmid primase-like protien
MIDSYINQSKVIEIEWFDFTDEIKEMLKKQTEERNHTALYRAIAEIYQVRYQNDELENVKHEDTLKFQVINSDVLDSKVYSNPSLAYYQHYNKKMFEDIDKIDNVADELQRKYKFVTLRKTEEILQHDGKIYNSSLAESTIKEETERLIPNCTTSNRNEVINKIKAQTYSDIENFDADPNTITVDNGILILKTMESIPHTPKNLSRVLYPVEYHRPKHEIKDETIFEDMEENLKDTLFWKFLKSSFTVDGKFRPSDFETILEVMASVFIKKQIDERAVMNLGQGENGKSVCLNYIISLLGKNNVSNMSLQDMTEDKFMLAELNGKSANIYADLEKNELRHTGKIKLITSNDPIQVQKKHGHPFTMYPFCKLIFSCNRFPKVFGDQGQGFFRRWIIVKWERNFENDSERDGHLLEKLTSNQDEKNLVFSCLVSLANKLNRVGKFTHSKDWKIIQKEWNENADPIDDFVSNYIVDSENNKSKRETYQFYKKIMLSKGENPLGMGKFSNVFSEYHDEYIVKDGKTERVWLNIDFKLPIQTNLKEHDD